LLVWDLPLYSSTGNVLTALFTPVDKPITLASLCEVAQLTTLTGSNQSGMAFSKQKTRTEATERVYIRPLACFSSGKEQPINGLLDQLSAKPSRLPYRWNAQHLGPPRYSIGPDISIRQERLRRAQRRGTHQPSLQLGGHRHRRLTNKRWGPLNTHARGTHFRHSRGQGASYRVAAPR
ncbi:hypothetical protein E2I00_014437, partial [Balaenoptera physalus]